MRITRRLSHTGAILTIIAAALITGLPGSAAAATAPVEISYQNPVSALPPISRPATPHCAVTAMRHDFANSYGQPFVGTLTPPSACPGPWSKVVLDWSGSVAGRQYDRLAGVWIGGAEVFRTSTPEPDPAGISWHVDADLSRYIPLLRTPQPLVVDLGNIVNGTYTGIYHMTLTVTYYQADRRNPAAASADQVIPVSQGGTASPGWWSLTAGQSATQTVTFPRNLSDATLEVFARGGGCEEFWYTNAPDAYNRAHPSYGLCGGGPYREVRVEVDGRLAGVAQPFPAIYSGGISPTMWRPIMSVDSLRTQPYAIELTPFAGLLSDGQPHQITLLPPTGISDVWTMDGSLFLTTDHHAAHTGGALLSDTISADPELSSSWTTPSTDKDVITTTASRDWTVSGYVNTSHGRVVTTVRQHLAYSNTDTVTQAGFAQAIAQKDNGYTQVSTSERHANGTRDSWSYPINVTSVYQPSSTGSGFLVRGSAEVSRIATTQVSLGDDWLTTAKVDDRVTAKGVLQRDDSGATVQADGSDAEDYYALAAQATPFINAGCYHHRIAADHGYLTSDRYLGCWG
ncbi:MAG TPA: peptide-N4-asparagine amidase [Actinocrinis sp.]|nr:peptide-N4-asparagine amidase [Actinocrinis sp.]